VFHSNILTIACRNSTDKVGQRSTISVLEGSPSPALFTAMMRYSSSFPFGCLCYDINHIHQEEKLAHHEEHEVQKVKNN